MSYITNFMKRHDIPSDRVDFSRLNEKQKEYESQLFEREIGGNSMNAETQYELAEHSMEFWKKEALGRDNFRLLDVGCGQGYHLYFAEKVGIAPYGLNLSFVESELARHGLPDEYKVMKWDENTKRNITIGFASELPFKDESFDDVGCYGVLMMTPHVERIYGGKRKPIEVCQDVCKELYRVLKPHGKLSLVTFNHNAMSMCERTEDYIFFGENNYFVTDINGNKYDEGSIGIGKLLEDAGFRNTQIKFGKDEGIWICKAIKKKQKS